MVFKEVNGDSLDVYELLKSKSHAAAFALFATSALGKAYLSRYAAKGQKIEINGKLIFEATADGENHKKGINLRYSLNNSKETSVTLTSPNMANSMDLNFFIAERGFGSQNRIFDLTKAIVHESFIHGELEQQDFDDDDGNFYNQSNLKRKNYIDDHDAVSKNYNSTTNLWPKGAEQILQRANGIIKSGLTNAQIKNIIWSFKGSSVNVNPVTGQIKQK